METVNLIFELFVNRIDAFAEQYKRDEKAVYVQRKAVLTLDYLQEHLEAKRTIGVYQLNPNNQVKWGCFDFDENTKEDFENAKKLYLHLKNKGMNPLLENSGGGEFKTHIWLFSDTDALSMRYFMIQQSEEIGVKAHEIFPKQTELGEGDYGNLVKLPLALNLKTGQRSFLMNEKFDLEPDFDACFLFHLNNKIIIPKIVVAPTSPKNEVQIDENNIQHCNFLDYALVHEVPKGKRHEIVSRNMAYYLHDKENLEILKEQYVRIQKGSPGELDNWLKGVEKGKAIPVVCGELISYQKEFKLPLKCRGCKKFEEFKKEKKEEERIALKMIEQEQSKSVELGKAISFFFNKKNLAEQFIKIQPYFFDKTRMWWIWNKKTYCWVQIDETDLFNEISKCSTANTISSKEKAEIIEALKQVGRQHVPQDFKNTWIQFKDKIYDLENDEFFESSPEFFSTNPIPWEINGSEETPIIDKLFEDWVGKEHKIQLYEIVGYCLLCDYPIHRLFCLIGGGSNGKSSFLRMIEKFVGITNVCSTELDVLTKSRFEATRLYRKLVCIMGETNFSTISQTSIIKKLTGQELMGFEYKNKTPFDAHNYAKILIATNNLPETTDKTDGWYRRWNIIDFPNQFEEKRDVINEIPDAEFSHLARKSLRVLREVMDRKNFSNEGTLKERAKRYEEKSNPFDKFWKECIIEECDAYVFKYEFKNKLDNWCEQNKMRKLNDTTISEIMRQKGIETGKMKVKQEFWETLEKRYNAWVGIKWK